MSRQRFIYPETFTSEDFNSLSLGARLMFVGTIATADDYGRGRAGARALKATIFPADTYDLETIAGWLAELMARGMILVYESEQSGTIATFYQIAKWDKYQKPKYKANSKIPCFQQDAGTRDKPGPDPETGSNRVEEKSNRVVIGLGCNGVGEGTGGEGGPRETPTSDAHTDGRPAPMTSTNRSNGGQNIHSRTEIQKLLQLARDRKSKGGRTKLAEGVISDLEQDLKQD